MRGPPRWARWLARRVIDPAHREWVVGDLDEEYARFILPRVGEGRARLWYLSQAVRSAYATRRASQPSPAHRPTSTGVLFMRSWIQDFRLGLRAFRRSPGFALLATVTLALGIGATTAIFSAVNQVMLRPLPFPDSDRLVTLWESNAERGWDQVEVAPANAMDWRERVSAFEDVALFSEFRSSLVLTGSGDPLSLEAGRATGNFFSVLQVQPMLGRTFELDETWSDRPPVAILTYERWRTTFGADPEIVGQTLRLNGESVEVIGVLGPDWDPPLVEADLWMTFRWDPSLPSSVWFRQAHVARGLARLRPGTTIASASAELATVAAELQVENPELNRGMEAGMTPLHSYLVGDRRASLLLLFGSVLLLQVIACANVANLLLVRAVDRKREMAVRSAMGAGRHRVVRQALTEVLAITVVGTVAGTLLGYLGLRWIAAIAPPELPEFVFHVDWRLVAFSAGIAGLSALVAGGLPALRSSGVDASVALNEHSRGGTRARGDLAWTRSIVSGQIALAVLLVTGAGILVNNLRELAAVDLGIESEGVLTFRLIVPNGSYPSDADRTDFSIRFVERLREMPEVQEAAALRTMPLTGWGWSSDFTIDDWGADEYGIDVRHRQLTSGYFGAMGVEVLDGALFADRLAPTEAVPVVVNQAFVDAYFPDESPVGRYVAFDRTPDHNSYWYPIVAVVANERLTLTDEAQPEIISHLRADTPQPVRFVVKTAGDPTALVPGIRDALRDFDDTVPMLEATSMDGLLHSALARDRFLMTLFGAFGVAALLLSAIGVYGVTAQAARARTREIGIRVALGATRSAIVGLLLRGAGVFVFAGVGVGVIGAYFGGRFIESLVTAVDPSDPAILTGVGVTLALVAVLSSYLPAHLATRVDPGRVLGTE